MRTEENHLVSLLLQLGLTSVELGASVGFSLSALPSELFSCASSSTGSFSSYSDALDTVNKPWMLIRTFTLIFCDSPSGVGLMSLTTHWPVETLKH